MSCTKAPHCTRGVAWLGSQGFEAVFDRVLLAFRNMVFINLTGVTEIQAQGGVLTGNTQEDGNQARNRLPRTSIVRLMRSHVREGSLQEFLAVVDIPSGYRLHEFRVLSGAMRERGIHLRVIFLSHGQRGRHWRFKGETFGFDHAFARGLSLYPAEHLPVHVNPGAWGSVMKTAPQWLCLGGSWYQPAVVASAIVSRAQHVLLWVESWQEQEAWVDRLRRSVMSRCGGFIVPGMRAERYALSRATRPALRLPNFVDEAWFGEQAAALNAERQAVRKSFGFGDETVFAWPARLDPVKGIVPFLEAVRDVRGRYAIAIAGEGPQRAEIERLVTAMPQVRLLGHLWPQDLVRLYAAADVLLLPSLFEPYGFVTVEGLWAALPLLLSNSVGALPEVLVEGGNGWVVDVSDAEHVRKVFAEAAETDRATLASMGKRSRGLAEARFPSLKCAEAFVDDLLRVFPS
jgi:glycosyltransferase involved in cell wall biosynthesis